MVQGATTATRSPGKLFLTCSGVGIGLVGAALLARYTHFVWAGPPLTIAALGFGYGFLGKRLQVQEPTEQASVEATEQS